MTDTNEERETGGTHEQVYNIVTSRDPSWQGIIYDLINSEQLDPWDIDVSALCNSYFEKIREMEEANFLISSKILLAASFLLRVKSEILLNKHIKEVDELLFGKKEENTYKLERIEIDESELPILLPKSPLPRFKRVTLQELMTALDQAITTESRRINKEIEKKQAERLSYVDIPKFKRASLRDRVRQFYAKILTAFKHPEHKSKIKIPYSHFTSNNKEEKIACFLPLLHLSNNNKLWLEQEGYFDEIYIYLYDSFKKNFPDHDQSLRMLEEELREAAEEAQEIVDKSVPDNPVGDLVPDVKVANVEVEGEEQDA